MIKQIIRVDIIDSTQTALKEMAALGAPHGTVIVAEQQTAGRGQFERTWNSQKGGLFFSALLRPSKKISQTSALTIKTAGAVVETLSEIYGIKSKIKKPNDVLSYDKNKKEYLKICGILTEGSVTEISCDWIVLGVGINLNNNLDKKLTATSVKKLLGREADMREFENNLFNKLSQRYAQWLLSTED
ncbi:Biotin/acetyl-CoA-carboxylase ligase [Elusimicrobium minutum Pei191]|uniref:Biotin/acetyl-CoA-carboxylase ligase n=1 Tax=Elusimicrobium minutum (strain Pei191) TaxID=445932 RepID=B2KEY6_ELUMP|nr:biotin--[acetyl-CoA-carboxylase] ligase [Elusimicrobium minutum]ACC99082.1 Biotin/acetyl-CoA-carboxylase ligase [Elusimicrobium minutum Pei191]